MSILFCTPCYGGVVTAQFWKSAMNLRENLYQAGLRHDWNVLWNESLVHRARNQMAANFLASDFSHMMFIDADIDFTTEDVAKIWNMQADVGVGVYAMKKPDQQWYAAWKDGALVKDLDQWKGPTEVDYAGTGFMLISRKVVERLTEKEGTYEGPDGRVPQLFMTPVHNDSLESEDYHFCRIARENGFKVIMDSSVRLGHIGQYRYGA